LEAFACDAGASTTFPTNQDDPCSRVVKQILDHPTPFWILFTTLLLLATTIAVDCAVTLPSGTRQTHCLWYETCWALKTAAFCSTFHPIIEPLICTEIHSQVPGFGPLRNLDHCCLISGYIRFDLRMDNAEQHHECEAKLRH